MPMLRQSPPILKQEMRQIVPSTKYEQWKTHLLYTLTTLLLLGLFG